MILDDDRLDDASLRGAVSLAILTALRQKATRIVTLHVAPDEVEKTETLIRQFAPAVLDRDLLRREGFPPCFRPDVARIVGAISVVTER